MKTLLIKYKNLKNNMVNLKSTVNQIGDKVTQVIHFKGGQIREFKNILSASITQDVFTKMKTTDGRVLEIMTKNVNAVIVKGKGPLVGTEYKGTKFFHFTDGTKLPFDLVDDIVKIGEFIKFTSYQQDLIMISMENLAMIEKIEIKNDKKK